MLQSEIAKKIEYYLERDMVFSALSYCKKLLSKESTEYRKFQYANILRLCGLFTKAHVIFSEIAIENIDKKYKYYYHLYFGHLFMDMGETEEAKGQFRECMKSEFCDTVPYIYMATLLKGEENNDEAISYLERALDKDGDIDEVYYNLANRYSIRGDFNLALAAIKKCLDISPDFTNAANIRSDIEEYITIKNHHL